MPAAQGVAGTVRPISPFCIEAILRIFITASASAAGPGFGIAPGGTALELRPRLGTAPSI